MKDHRIGCNTLYPDVNERKAGGWTFSPQKIMDALKKLSEIGYTDTEYSHIYHLSIDDATKIGEYAQAVSINSWSCHAAGPGGFNTGDAVESAIAANRHCVDISSALGAEVNVLHIWNHTHEDACRILEQVCQYAVERNVSIALENNRSVEGMEFILGIAGAVDMPNIGICVDTGHANLGDLGAARAIRMAGSLLLTTHLQDNLGERDDHMPPGMGIIDWADVFRALVEIDYKRTLMLELTDAPTADSRVYEQEEEIRTGLKNVRAFLNPE
ncbi:sugar phosphate isomerase/epimerase family protein [Candidatus Poribacteria bacterium]